jgi:hypothetical protein
MAGRLLSASGQAVVDATGRAVVVMRPGQAHETWDVVMHSVRIVGAAFAELRVYHGAEADSNFIDSTYDGVNASSPQTPGTLVIYPGDYLTFVWDLCDVPGALAVANVRYQLNGLS